MESLEKNTGTTNQLAQNSANKEIDAMKMLLKLSSKIPFFSILSKDEIEEIITEVKIITYKNKEIIFQEGETTRNYIYYLLKGKLYINRKKQIDSRSSVRIATIDKPALFGEMMRLTGEPRSATVESGESNTLVLAFRIKDFKEQTSISKFYKNVIIELSAKIVQMNKKHY
ncbi:cyclic nucleotide-binding domain-containing protein [Arcobacter sp. KX21116]|jgi:CRP-like cAMP-binding protein|uniref:Crp/Fnr family transcriptional regulator n=1 Tax=Arcobacter iocasae TaxID=2906515 RepID=UPI0035D45A0F|tara:strand:+ start:8387 stop:8899 length:513 start_codon:yes stop_codon:yes gene_type:complete